MATKAVKVKAHKRLSGTGKIENVDAHVRKIEKGVVSDADVFNAIMQNAPKEAMRLSKLSSTQSGQMALIKAYESHFKEKAPTGDSLYMSLARVNVIKETKGGSKLI